MQPGRLYHNTNPEPVRASRPHITAIIEETCG